MFSYLTSCFQDRGKNDLRGSNLTLFENMEGQPKVDEIQLEIIVREQSGQDLNIFDFHTLQNFFNEQF